MMSRMTLGSRLMSPCSSSVANTPSSATARLGHLRHSSSTKRARRRSVARSATAVTVSTMGIQVQTTQNLSSLASHSKLVLRRLSWARSAKSTSSGSGGALMRSAPASARSCSREARRHQRCVLKVTKPDWEQTSRSSSLAALSTRARSSSASARASPSCLSRAWGSSPSEGRRHQRASRGSAEEEEPPPSSSPCASATTSRRSRLSTWHVSRRSSSVRRTT
mmetsp:Transcript_106546/g.311472  ORF Transcript_106546/g.311472 Transcript_106546/m.311472 type:complete len:222 (+) Transcript_106546:101-766(+)